MEITANNGSYLFSEEGSYLFEEETTYPARYEKDGNRLVVEAGLPVGVGIDQNTGELICPEPLCGCNRYTKQN